MELWAKLALFRQKLTQTGVLGLADNFPTPGSSSRSELLEHGIDPHSVVQLPRDPRLLGRGDRRHPLRAVKTRCNCQLHGFERIGQTVPPDSPRDTWTAATMAGG